MLEIFFALLAAGMNGASASDANQMNAQPPVQSTPLTTAESTVRIDQNTAVIGQGSAIASAPEASATVPMSQTSGFNMAVIPAGLVADPQIATGKFTTATEVKPILNATKGNWVGVREFGGQDLLYVSHLWAWRCGLKALAISVNAEAMQNWPLPPCREQFATPNAILEGDGAPYLTLRQGSVSSITIQIVYDDLSMDAATFERANVLIP